LAPPLTPFLAGDIFHIAPLMGRVSQNGKPGHIPGLKIHNFKFKIHEFNF